MKGVPFWTRRETRPPPSDTGRLKDPAYPIPLIRDRGKSWTQNAAAARRRQFLLRGMLLGPRQHPAHLRSLPSTATRGRTLCTAKPVPSTRHRVGYGRPPVEHRFKQGNNANPKGRKK